MVEQARENIEIIDKYGNMLYYLGIDRHDLHKSARKHKGIHIIIEMPAKKDCPSKFLLQLQNNTAEYPGMFNSPVCGHIRYNELKEESAIRVIKDDLNIDITKEDLNEEFVLDISQDTGNELVTVYSYLLDNNVQVLPNNIDIEAIIFVTLKELKNMVKETPFKFSPVFLKIFKKFVGLTE